MAFLLLLLFLDSPIQALMRWIEGSPFGLLRRTRTTFVSWITNHGRHFLSAVLPGFFHILIPTLFNTFWYWLKSIFRHINPLDVLNFNDILWIQLDTIYNTVRSHWNGSRKWCNTEVPSRSRSQIVVRTIRLKC